MHIIEEILVRRNLIRELVVKDLKIRYSRPILGFFWAFLSPLLIVGIFYLVFSSFLQVKTKESPFLLYLMSGVFSWKFFQDSLMSSVTSLIDNKNLIKESKFPHYLIPLSIVLANSINFLPSLAILIITALFVLKGLPVFIILLPIILAIHLIIIVGMSIIFSIIYVKWRDTRYILEAVLLVLFYLTPVFYSIYLVKDSLPSIWFSVYIYNPFVGILNLYRFAILKGFYSFIKGDIGLLSLIIFPAGFAIALLLFSLHFYKQNKNSINDYLAY
jgi:ABC-type polysaccharide/polyol phosphate export permease